jgi:Peptidase A4 family
VEIFQTGYTAHRGSHRREVGDLDPQVAEQDVDSTAAASYSAWWELVPAPSLTISSMTVESGDHIHASISEVVPDSDVWTITLQDVTRGESFTQTAPYPFTHATADWIEVTPLEIGTDAGFA